MTVTLHVWTVPTARIPWALTRMATDRGRVRRAPGLTFAKLLGTGRGRSFAPGDADLRRWALLSCWSSAAACAQWESSAVADRWRQVAAETWRVELAPLASRGTWSGTEPFGTVDAAGHDGAVAALTRARLRPRKARTFWRSAPGVAAELWRHPGLRLAIGIGEAPIGLQGTFSVWESARAMREFAYASPRHLAAIADTRTIGWYSEELFARFAVLASSGTLDGRDPAR